MPQNGGRSAPPAFDAEVIALGKQAAEAETAHAQGLSSTTKTACCVIPLEFKNKWDVMMAIEIVFCAFYIPLVRARGGRAGGVGGGARCGAAAAPTCYGAQGNATQSQHTLRKYL